MLGALEMLKNGVTAVQDDAFFVPAPAPEIIDAVMQAYRDSGIRATLAGDRVTLERLFQVDFAGSVAHWTLQLVPRDPATLHSIARIRIEGSGDDLSRVEIGQANGDRSLMTLRPAPTP